MDKDAPLLRMTGISKSFPGVVALDDVSFSIERGEVHALLGENGAGKSTLLKILAGAQSADRGSIEINGQKIVSANPHEAQQHGIVTIYQEFTLAPNMSIADNVFVGREPGSPLFVNRRELEAQTETLTRRIGLERSVRTLVHDLSVAEQQMVEIARALSMQSKLIVMDEPTSALSRTEVENLFGIIRTLKAEGISTIFVTHRLEEVFEICDRFTVLRDGHNAGHGAVADTNIEGIIRLMVGRQLSGLLAHRNAANLGPVALKAENLVRLRTPISPAAIEIRNVSLEVRRGEILGLAGLVGAGRTETARAIFGADPFDSGRILVDGQPVSIRSPEQAIRLGIGLVPEDRKQQALFLALAIRTNLSITVLDRISQFASFISARKEASLVEDYRQRLNIRMASPDQLVGNLSGGNQQKVVLARWLALGPKVLIVDEPTRGIDVGAKVEVHNLLFEMADAGIAIIAISSELPEILAISDRIVTMREGMVTGEIMRDAADQEKLMTMMTLTESRAA
ncbi:MAG TPA: sugar ABC transporter ATP-binding protein [Devosiaceae bacterium]|nr:sugar ABC transporter ATP-binding protein [Devosiaceae bacterium]